MKGRRGISPVVATVLLIVMVIAIALIVFLWMRGFVSEAILKFDKNIELVCGEVAFDTSYNGGILYVSNNGNVPIYDMKIQIYNSGIDVEDLKSLSYDEWGGGLKSGGGFSDTLSFSGTKIVLIPVLQGEGENGNKKEHLCEEHFGKTIVL